MPPLPPCLAWRLFFLLPLGPASLSIASLKRGLTHLIADVWDIFVPFKNERIHPSCGEVPSPLKGTSSSSSFSYSPFFSAQHYTYTHACNIFDMHAFTVTGREQNRHLSHGWDLISSSLWSLGGLVVSDMA